jgi:hypothetical protein
MPCPLPDGPTLFFKHFGKTISPYLGLADNQRKQVRDEPLEVDTQLLFAPDVDFVSLGFNGPHDFFGANLGIHPGGLGGVHAPQGRAIPFQRVYGYVGAHKAGAYHGHPDAFALQFRSERFEETVEGVLGGGIGRTKRRTELPYDAAVDHDVA